MTEFGGSRVINDLNMLPQVKVVYIGLVNAVDDAVVYD